MLTPDWKRTRFKQARPAGSMICRSRPGAILRLPAYLKDPHRLFEASGDELSAISEEESFAGTEAPDDVGHQYLPAVRFGRDACGHVDCRAERVASPTAVVFGNRATGMLPCGVR